MICFIIIINPFESTADQLGCWTCNLNLPTPFPVGIYVQFVMLVFLFVICSVINNQHCCATCKYLYTKMKLLSLLLTTITTTTTTAIIIKKYIYTKDR